MLFRKKPVVIEAIRWTGRDSYDAVAAFLDGVDVTFCNPNDRNGRIVIPTLEGDMTANVGDWIIRGVQGECYPCRNDIFRATYERV